MRLFLTLAWLLISFSTAFAGSKEDAIQVIDAWAKAFTASDVDGIVNFTRQMRSSLELEAKPL
jgi:hypothetical protein